MIKKNILSLRYKQSVNNYNIGDDLVEKIDAYQKTTNIPRATIVRLCLAKYLDIFMSELNKVTEEVK